METEHQKYISLINSKIKQEMLLRFLLNDVPLSGVDIKRKLVEINISQVSFTLKELEKDNLILCVNPQNKRNRFYRITQEGKETMDLINEQILQVALEKNFKNMGYQVKKKTSILGFRPDIVLSRNDTSIVVEVKRSSISRADILQVFRYKRVLSADRAIIVTIFDIDEKAKELAIKYDVEVWDGKRLDKLQGRILYPKKKSDSRKNFQKGDDLEKQLNEDVYEDDDEDEGEDVTYEEDGDLP